MMRPPHGMQDSIAKPRDCGKVCGSQGCQYPVRGSVGLGSISSRDCFSGITDQ